MRLRTVVLRAIAGSLLGIAGSAVSAAAMDDLQGSVVLNEEAINEVRNDIDRRVQVAGYTDVEYILDSKAGKYPGFRMHHLSLFFKKKINEKWRWFSEIEFEDAPKHEFVNDGSNAVDTGYGKIFVEAVNLDYVWKPELSVRVGRFFTPAGIWSVDHYPPFVPTQERPGHIRKLFPQLADGLMAFGTIKLGGMFFKYDAYLSNGDGNTGHHDQNAEKALGLKGDLVLPMFQHLSVGGSFYTDPKDSAKTDLIRTAFGAHAKLRAGNLTLQTEGGYRKNVWDANDATLFSASGYYVQAMYALGKIAAGYRYDNFWSDRSDAAKETLTNTVFVNYRIDANLVLKAEHHMMDSGDTKTVFSAVAYLE